MTIYTDGARSRRRIPAAKRAIRIIKSLGMSQKVGMRDGFIFKVTEDGRGFIKAPFGIYVVLVDEKGVRQFTCDSVSSPAEPWFEKDVKDRYVLLPDPMPPIVYSTPGYTDYPDATDLYAAVGGSVSGIQNTLAHPVGFITPIEYRDLYQWSAPEISVISTGSELVVLNMCYERTSKHWVNTTQITHCFNPGMNDVENEVSLPSITTTWAASNGLTAGYNAERRVPIHTTPGYFGYVAWKPGLLWSDNRIVQIVYQGFSEQQYYAQNLAVTGLLPAPPTGQYFRLIAVHASRRTIDELPDDLPNMYRVRATCVLSQGLVFVNFDTGHTARDFTYLRTAIKNVLTTEMFWVYFTYLFNNFTPPYNLRGGLALAGAFPETGGSGVGGAVATSDLWYITAGGTITTIPPGGTDPSDIPVDTSGALFALTDTPGQDPAKWVVQESFATLDAKTDQPSKDTVNSLISQTLGAMFGWPDDSGETSSERDTVTFSDAEGVVYSWVRSCDPAATQNAWGALYTGTRLGGFKFDYASGVSRVALSVPESVRDNSTLRPKLLLVTDTAYLCVADSRDGHIHSVDVGSPLTGVWDNIVLPQDVVMYAVRTTVAADTGAETGLIGLGKVTGESREYFVFIKPPSKEWIRLSPLPIDVGDVVDLAASWDLCLVGDDALAGRMMQVKQNHSASPARNPRLR